VSDRTDGLSEHPVDIHSTDWLTPAFGVSGSFSANLKAEGGDGNISTPDKTRQWKVDIKTAMT